MTSGTAAEERFTDIGKNPKTMKKKQLTPEQEEFFKQLGTIIDSDLANLLKDYTLEQIMKAKISFLPDEKTLSLTIKIEFE